MTYEYYEINLSGKEQVKLTYKLIDCRPAQIWAGLINSVTPEALRKNLNAWQDFDKSILSAKLEELQNLIIDLNDWLPDYDKINYIWNDNNPQLFVNRLHIHFPEYEKTETSSQHLKQLSHYNDLIHEIECLVQPKSYPELLICPDEATRCPLEPDDYKLFTSKRFFGDLTLHYCHVGRHPLELFLANDFNCPEDQIIPQTMISTYHRLRFYGTDIINLEHWTKGRFYDFYQRSTLKNVMKWNDPKMAFGYIPMGKLIEEFDRTTILDKVRNCDKVVSWKSY